MTVAFFKLQKQTPQKFTVFEIREFVSNVFEGVQRNKIAIC